MTTLDASPDSASGPGTALAAPRAGEPGPLVSIESLDIGFSHPRPAVSGLDLSILPGEIHALVGESGSGKSMTARALVGLLPAGAKAEGTIRVDGTQILGAGERELSALRGATIGLVFQEPQSALNPVRTVGWQLGEALRAHGRLSRAVRREKTLALLRLVEIPEPELRLRSYPHQLSGGQKQRIAIALALAAEPRVLVADEPTTALDVTVQKEILELLARLARQRDLAVLLITHDMGVVANYAHRVTVLLRGQVVETGSLDEVFSAPRDPYTRRLLRAVPRLRAQAGDAGGEGPAAADAPRAVSTVSAEGAENAEPVVFGARGLGVAFGHGAAAVHALRDITLSVRAGRTLALVGESGSGKTTLGRVAAGLQQPSSGTVFADGSAGDTAIIPQDPVASLNPRRTVGDSIREPLDIRRVGTRAQRAERVAELLDSAGLPSDFARRYPAELSGGQRQRVAIARALTLSPSLVVADEPTSALDVSVQADIVRLLAKTQEAIGFAAIFITHDLALVDGVADDVAVLRRGELVELGPVDDVLARPKTEYTRALLDAVPTIDGRRRDTDRHTPETATRKNR
ncbi:ABC transporter ATP-binding protein [Dietzia sp.]|uniref:ABC transporter ATP-binding protein n=1 Tax=Dietzia sp. TaxID=1871616 RepID=UPI002FD990FB